MILPIYTYGQPVLKKETEEIDKDYPQLDELIDNMFETMEKSDGVGLAAPQVGLSIRLVVIGLDCLSEDYPQYKDFNKAFINPYIEEYGTETDGYEEGCLSFPGIHEKVIRPTKVRVSYLDRDFNEHDEWIDGFLARVIQHEVDHLDGTCFVDRLSPLRKQMVKGKLKNLHDGKFYCDYKVKPLKK